jgi:hypothetical protein
VGKPVSFGDDLGLESFAAPAGVYARIPVHVVTRWPATSTTPEVIERYVNLEYVVMILEAARQAKEE